MTEPLLMAKNATTDLFLLPQMANRLSYHCPLSEKFTYADFDKQEK